MKRPDFVGREQERVFLHEELTLSTAGHGRLVVLGGEAGIGKTTLVQSLCAEAAELGVFVLQGNCYDLSTTPPYGLWIDLAAGYPVDGVPALPVALRDGEFAGTTNQLALFGAVQAFFAEFCRSRPVLLVFEDVHWADQASLDLIRSLVTRLRGLRLLVVVTYRIDELTRKHPLFRQLPALVTAGGGQRIDLRGLEPADLRALVRSHGELTPPDEARLCAYLARHAEGNPLFSGELLRALIEEGLLRQTGATWALAELDRVVLPSMIGQVIEARVSRLSGRTQQALMIAAVIGHEVPIELWATLGGYDADAMIAIIEEATEAHVLESGHSGERVRFVHALTREAVYASVIPLRRRALHGTVAHALIDRPRADPDDIAYHLVSAGDPRAPEWLVRAGNRAMRAYAWMLASERFVAAAAALAAEGQNERERAWLLYRAARLLRIADPERGLRLLNEVERLARSSGDELLGGEAHYSQGLLTMYTGDFASGLQTMIDGIEMIRRLPEGLDRGDPAIGIALADSLPERESEVEADIASANSLFRSAGVHHRSGSLSLWLSDTGEVSRAIVEGEWFMEQTERAPNPGGLVRIAQAHALHGLATAYAEIGAIERSREAFERALARYRRSDHHGVIAVLFLHRLRSLTLVFDLLDAKKCDDVARDAVESLQLAGGAVNPDVPADVGGLALQMLRGDWKSARRIVDECPETPNTYFDAELLLAGATLALYDGNDERFQTLVRRAFPEGPESEHARYPLLVRRAVARLAATKCLDDGDSVAAGRWLDAHDRMTPDAGIVIGRAEGLAMRSRLAREEGDLHRARSLAEDAISAARVPVQPLGLIIALQEFGAAMTGLACYEGATAALTEAAELAIRAALPVAQAETALAHADLFDQRGEAERAVECRSTAERLAEALGARRILEQSRQTPRVRSVSPPTPSDAFGLTPRERQVLHYVAQGLTDAEVGDELFISPRTVSQHLRSVFGKLEVSTRSAATRIAVEHGLV